MKFKLRLWMIPVLGIIAFVLSTCVQAAFAAQRANTQCMFGVIYEAREHVNDRFLMQFRVMAYRDQVADDNWAFPDVFICTRR